MELTEEFYTVDEVAVMMRTSRMTVYRMVHDGKIQRKRFGKSFRIPRSEVERVLDPEVDIDPGTLR
jgi:excisionase family DNA binding protein